MTTKPAVSRADMTRSNILSAARSLFIEHGYGGTSMGKIAAKANVNHSLLFHHFSNKQNLWLEVKNHILEEGKAVVNILPSSDLPLKPFLTELLNQSIEFYKSNPDIVRMTSWQRLEYETPKTIGLTYTEETKNWMEACEHFKRKGEINATLKTEFIMTFILAIVSSLALDPNAFIQDDAEREAYVNFSVELLVKALSA